MLLKRRNAKELLTPKFKPKIVKPLKKVVLRVEKIPLKDNVVYYIL